jgi:hypothetical protein
MSGTGLIFPLLHELSMLAFGHGPDPAKVPSTDLPRLASAPNPGLLCGASVNSIVFTLGYGVLRKGLTVAGVLHAWFLGTSVYAAFGYGGHLLVCLYFIFGTLVRCRGMPTAKELDGNRQDWI